MSPSSYQENGHPDDVGPLRQTIHSGPSWESPIPAGLAMRPKTRSGPRPSPGTSGTSDCRSRWPRRCPTSRCGALPRCLAPQRQRCPDGGRRCADAGPPPFRRPARGHHALRRPRHPGRQEPDHWSEAQRPPPYPSLLTPHPPTDPPGRRDARPSCPRRRGGIDHPPVVGGEVARADLSALSSMFGPSRSVLLRPVLWPLLTSAGSTWPLGTACRPCRRSRRISLGKSADLRLV